ncbi:hypothetical protein LX83_003342 [Goodfellowiella coeruleoviolacea]|uniref:Uncharacterized protein n=1 Tax=Goodfellowiella coeruleoviolacea TaxID=334858 RepID=A0AAE3KHI4_9PSEU|nr:hypothetical protein [Goodfellowiella coeruleoviolacea]
MRTAWKLLPRRSAPGSPANDQSPPSTRSGRSVHCWNWLPTSLHPVNAASKRLQRLNTQPTNAESVCREALSRTLVKTQSVNTAPRLVASVRSTSTKEHRV